MPTEHHIITRLKKFLPVFNAYFSKDATTEHATRVMHVSIANIIRDAQAIAVGLSHIDEAHFDRKELSDEFAHLVTFAINLPTTIEGDGGFWGYALGLVDGDAFKAGVEYQSIERIDDFIQVLQKVRAIKVEIGNRAVDLDL